jgi:hypothetical protein
MQRRRADPKVIIRDLAIGQSSILLVQVGLSPRSRSLDLQANEGTKLTTRSSTLIERVDYTLTGGPDYSSCLSCE